MRDTIYSQQQTEIKDFVFDHDVVDVFPDMIQRSIPGYSTIVSSMAKLAGQFHQANSNLYDLGCSLGAVTLAMRKSVSEEGCQIIGIDNSAAMVERCRQHLSAFKSQVKTDIICADITEVELHNASVVTMNFTMQFVKPEQRQALVNKIYQALRPGGVLLFSEKLNLTDGLVSDTINNLHLDFKRANGYSELEISQKRSAIENVMIIDTQQQHFERLAQAGFTDFGQWYQCFNFASFIAIKK